MATGKIEVQIGSIRFSGEGSEDWLTSELGILYERAAGLSQIPIGASEVSSAVTGKSEKTVGDLDAVTKTTLPAYLQSKGAVSNQVKKFLATAMWQMAKSNKSKFQTKDITSALAAAQQAKLSNASVSLSNNIKKGFVEKDGDGYYITPDGKTSLGLSA